jgi:hypothetical protein
MGGEKGFAPTPLWRCSAMDQARLKPSNIETRSHWLPDPAGFLRLHLLRVFMLSRKISIAALTSSSRLGR